MSYTITKTDRRHTGNHVMKYIIEVNLPRGFNKSRERINQFKEYRVWMWETFGPSCELDNITLIGDKLGEPSSVERWAWRTDFEHLRLYIRGDEELAWFKLKWTNDENN